MNWSDIYFTKTIPFPLKMKKNKYGLVIWENSTKLGTVFSLIAIYLPRFQDFIRYCIINILSRNRWFIDTV